jgi:hypothetical protein
MVELNLVGGHEIMKRTPVNSSAIVSVGYDAEKQHMQVEFNGGRTYTYQDVPESAHEDLINADSIGKHFNQHISGRYKTI